MLGDRVREVLISSPAFVVEGRGGDFYGHAQSSTKGLLQDTSRPRYKLVNLEKSGGETWC